MADEGSEYGGQAGIIQPDLDRVDADAARAGLGHASDDTRAADRRGVRDADMVVRRAGLMEARGVPAETTVDPDTGVYSFIQYDEERARQDLVQGDNWPVMGEGGSSDGL